MSTQAVDRDALRRLQAGDHNGLSELFDRHSPLVLGLAMRILRDRSNAEDVLQETWVQVWNRCRSYDPARGSVAAWIVTIARTRALDRARRARTRDRVESGAPGATLPAPTPNPAEGAVRSQMRDVLGQALASLDPKHREALELAYFEGLSQSEVAERIGAPLGTVKYWMRQGLLRLRELVPGEET